MSPWTFITRTFICISMFSFNINIWIHSFFDAKRLIGRNSVDAEAQSDFRVFSNPRFVCNTIEERKKNSYVVSFFRLFLVLTSFISWMVLKMKETAEYQQCYRHRPFLFQQLLTAAHKGRRNQLVNGRSPNQSSTSRRRLRSHKKFTGFRSILAEELFDVLLRRGLLK